MSKTNQKCRSESERIRYRGETFWYLCVFVFEYSSAFIVSESQTLTYTQLHGSRFQCRIDCSLKHSISRTCLSHFLTTKLRTDELSLQYQLKKSYCFGDFRFLKAFLNWRSQSHKRRHEIHTHCNRTCVLERVSSLRMSKVLKTTYLDASVDFFPNAYV